MEDPGWGSLLDLIPALGLRTVPVPVDDEGPLPDDVRRALEGGARALIVTDRAQNPTGAALSAARAQALRAVLADHPETLLIEDDHGHHIVDLPLHPLAGRHAPLGLLPLGRQGVRARPASRGPHRRPAHPRPGAGTAAARARLGQPDPPARGGPAVGRRHGGPGNRRGALRGTPGRLDGGAAPARDRGAGRSGMNLWVPVPDETGVVARLLHAGWAVAPGARFRMNTPRASASPSPPSRTRRPSRWQRRSRGPWGREQGSGGRTRRARGAGEQGAPAWAGAW